MPSNERHHALAVSEPADSAPLAELRRRALDVLLDPGLAHVMDVVAWTDAGEIHVANSRGHAATGADGWVTISGANPVAELDPLVTGSYPLAATRLASAFADPDRSPDLWVSHTGAHHWPEQGGHLGEHGALNQGQSRAPLVLSGSGVTARGTLPRYARTVDVGPTLAHAAGVTFNGADGAPLTDLVTGARHVVGLLWDGAHPGELAELAADGQLPAVARLLARGCQLAGGAVAEFPSVTLVNHTSALTGVGPGRHGIVHNVFFDRRSGERILANDSSTWHRACTLLRPGVRTLWEVLGAARPDAQLACVDEPIDRGATYSTFALVRDSGEAKGAKSLGDRLPDPTRDQHATQTWVAQNPDYAWSTQVDGLGLDQVLELWGGDSPPDVMWWNTTLTDTGHHAGGPGSDVARAALRDSDLRLGVFLDLLEERGLLDDTFILLTADHGMEKADPACVGNWDEALLAAGVPFRDEGYGAIYLGTAANS